MSDRMALDGRMISEWQIGKDMEESSPYCTAICLEGLKKSMKFSIRMVGVPAEIRMALFHSSNKSEALPLQLTCSVKNASIFTSTRSYVIMT
jgi:hypothetical protein